MSLRSKGITTGSFAGVNTAPFAQGATKRDTYAIAADNGIIYGGNGCWRSKVDKKKKPTETGCFARPLPDCEWNSSAWDLNHKPKGK
jgi:hypothetical protein